MRLQCIRGFTDAHLYQSAQVQHDNRRSMSLMLFSLEGLRPGADPQMEERRRKARGGTYVFIRSRRRNRVLFLVASPPSARPCGGDALRRAATCQALSVLLDMPISPVPCPELEAGIWRLEGEQTNVENRRFSRTRKNASHQRAGLATTTISGQRRGIAGQRNSGDGRQWFRCFK